LLRAVEFDEADVIAGFDEDELKVHIVLPPRAQRAQSQSKKFSAISATSAVSYLERSSLKLSSA